MHKFSLAAAGLVFAAAGLIAADTSDPYVVVLGIAQDGGVPHAGCKKECCAGGARQLVVSLGLVDPATGERWIFEATPDFPDQLRILDGIAPPREGLGISGIFLTHGHIGHYTGLMHLGREVLGASGVPIFAMPRMSGFLSTNGPWDQLVTLGNITLKRLEAGVAARLNGRLTVTPIQVPHRDEYTETVGFHIRGPNRSILLIPDIDKWEKWDQRIEDVLASVDVAYVDGTFYANGEIASRDMSEIPHPFIMETMARLKEVPSGQRAKVRFIHLNHTNPALVPGSAARLAIEAVGFRVAEQLERVGL